MSGYSNPDFDQLADESEGAMDVEKRRDLIRRMQKIIVNDVPYIPIYNPMIIEAVKTDAYKGWVEMVGGIGNIWSFCLIKPD